MLEFLGFLRKKEMKNKLNTKASFTSCEKIWRARKKRKKKKRKGSP